MNYHRRTVDEIDRKVISHLHEYGKITNRTLQNLFDIDLWPARDILADLQQRELIVRRSEAARGPGVEYGPGPRLPSQAPHRGRQGDPDEGRLRRHPLLGGNDPAVAAASQRPQLQLGPAWWGAGSRL